MTLPKKYHVPFVTALWMIALPIAVWFFAGAGAGTIFGGLARFLETMFAVYGGASLIIGALLLLWSLAQAWRDGALARGEV